MGALIIDVVIVFGVISYYAIKRIVQTGSKPVHTYCLVAIYFFWWIGFLLLFGMGMYSAIAHDEVIHTMGYISLGAVWLDLWHPVRLIQKQSSIRVINKATLMDTTSMYESTSLNLAELSVQKMGYEAGMSSSEKTILIGQARRPRKARARNQIQCDLTYWEFLIFSGWIGVFVSLALTDLHNSTCWLSVACVLPTIANIWMFYKHDTQRMKNRICVKICLMVIISLVVMFSVLSCTCFEHEIEVCEWAHIMVIASVMLFVFLHLHQKSKSR